MDSPHLDQFGERELLGAGPSGAVFRALRPDGSAVAVKLLDGMAVNRVLLEKACRRLEQGDWPVGVLEVIEADFRSRPAARVTRCLADLQEDGQWMPRCLQHRLVDFPGEDSWKVVMELADALASLHGRQVAHGNLKPGNVFFDDGGNLVLVDWALGNMPGIGHMEFTDACLYQPPEQLRSAEGYLEEQGYRWDVFAFGVITYRLLVGGFPRCDATFQQVAPPPGKTAKEGVSADLQKIARDLESQPVIEWSSEPTNELEARLREIIDECLAIEPLARPANGMELRRRFREAELVVEEEQKRDAVLDQRRRSQRVAWRASLTAGALLVGAVVLALLWQLTRSQLVGEIDGRKNDVEQLRARVAVVEGERDDALLHEQVAEDTLKTEQSIWLARVEESRAIGDKLFSWALEKGHRKLPPLDGRELRLARLDSYFTKFLERTEGVVGLADERARARLQLAEISLANGKPKLAAERLEKAISGAEDLDDGNIEMRLATDRLILALLLQDANDGQASAAFLVARQALESVPQSQVDGERVIQLLSILDIHESRELAAAGEDARALELLHRATENLNQLADRRPETSILRSELVSCYLSSATILDGMGEMGDARAVRTLAADALIALIKEQPGDLNLRLELAGCYGAIADSSLLAGDVGNAEAMSKAAVKLLTEVLPQRPDSVVARSRLAAQRGLMAGIQRDRGKPEKAMELYDEGLRLLEDLTVGEKADPLAKYRFILLTWEKGKMLGFSGKRDEEIEYEQRAVKMMDELLESPYGVSHSERLQRSLGYLLGDLGHAAQVGKNSELGASVFNRAVKLWEKLVRDRPGNEEYEEALDWNRQRLDALE